MDKELRNKIKEFKAMQREEKRSRQVKKYIHPNKVNGSKVH
jgi:hypothetical protein